MLVSIIGAGGVIFFNLWTEPCKLFLPASTVYAKLILPSVGAVSNVGKCNYFYSRMFFVHVSVSVKVCICPLSLESVVYCFH